MMTVCWCIYCLICFSLEFSVGFREIQHTTHKGKNVTLIVEEREGFIGGSGTGGVPEDWLVGAFPVLYDFYSTAIDS